MTVAGGWYLNIEISLNILVRSGGHSYTCTNIKQDSVHIDMRGMDSIELTQVILSKMRKRKKPIVFGLDVNFW